MCKTAFGLPDFIISITHSIRPIVDIAVRTAVNIAIMVNDVWHFVLTCLFAYDIQLSPKHAVASIYNATAISVIL